MVVGADSRARNDFKRRVYGSVQAGNVIGMDSLEYFSRGVQGHLAGHIQCWEVDNSGSAFYNRLMNTLRAIAGYSIDAAVNATAAGDWGDVYGGPGKGAAIMVLVATCSALVAGLLAWLRNDDDLVFQREIAFTRLALDQWLTRPNGELSFMFEGGSPGKHDLWIVSYTSEKYSLVAVDSCIATLALRAIKKLFPEDASSENSFALHKPFSSPLGTSKRLYELCNPAEVPINARTCWNATFFKIRSSAGRVVRGSNHSWKQPSRRKHSRSSRSVDGCLSLE